MEKPLISVIVPVYNVKQYLEKCVQSIINQSYTNLEILLVNDGSTDGSGELCNQIATNDERIRVIHKENGGLSSARNAAIDVMEGQYVTFVDSDDYVSKEYVKTLYDLINENNTQISVCGEKWFSVSAEGVEIQWESPYVKFDGRKVLSAKEGLETILNQHFFDASANGKMYESKLFCDVRYPIQKNHEDVGTTYKLFLKSICVACTSTPLYYYLQREGSILHDRTNTKTLWDGIEMVEQQYKEVVNVYPDLKAAARCRCFSMYCRCYKIGLKAKDKALVKVAWDNIYKSRVAVIRSKNIRKKAKYAAVLSLLGKKLFSALIVKLG